MLPNYITRIVICLCEVLESRDHHRYTAIVNKSGKSCNSAAHQLLYYYYKTVFRGDFENCDRDSRDPKVLLYVSPAIIFFRGFLFYKSTILQYDHFVRGNRALFEPRYKIYI